MKRSCFVFIFLVIIAIIFKQNLHSVAVGYRKKDLREMDSLTKKCSCERYENLLRKRIHLYYTPYFSKVANPWNDYWGWPYYGMAQGNYGGNMGVVVGPSGFSFFGSNY